MDDDERTNDEEKIAYANIRNSLSELCRQQSLELEQQNKSNIPKDIQEELDKELKDKVIWRKIIRRLSMVVVVFLLVGGTVAFGINRGLLYNVFEKNTEIDYAGNKKQKQEKMVIYEPTYLPEGFTKDSIDTDNKSFYSIVYSNDNESVLLLNQQINVVHNDDYEGIDVEYVRVNNTEGFYYTGDNHATIVWTFENTLMELVGNPIFSSEEMIKIAESIKESEN